MQRVVALAAMAAWFASSPTVQGQQGDEATDLRRPAESLLEPPRRNPAPTPREPFDKEGALAELTPAPEVGDRGDLKRLRIVGAEAFDANSISSALSADLVYQAAARPSSDLPKLVDVLRQRILAGYLHVGYLDAAVDASYDGAANGLVAEIDEGRPYRAGVVRVVGHVAVDAADLIKRIARPSPDRPWTYSRLVDITGDVYPESGCEKDLNAPGEGPAALLWKAGDPFPGDAETLDGLARQIELHLVDMGFPFARIRLRADPAANGATADLVVEIESEGAPATVSEIHVRGLSRHTEQQLCEYLNIRQGMRLDATELERIYQALRNSCRFWRYAVFVRFAGDAESRYGNAGTIDLGLTVEEYDQVPPLGQPLPDVDECLVRTAAWLQEFWTRESDEEFIYEGDCPVDGAESPFGDLRVVLSRRHGCLATVFGQNGDVAVDAAGIISPDGFACYDWRSGKKFTFVRGVSPRFDLQLSGGEIADGQHRCQVKFGLGMACRPPDDQSSPQVWNARVEPVALVQVAHRRGVSASIEEGVLTIIGEASQCRIDADTGRLLSLTYDDGVQKGTIRVVEDEFQSALDAVRRRSGDLQEMFEPGAPLTSAASFVLHSAVAQPRLDRSPLARLACERAVLFLERGDADPAVHALCDQLWGRSVGDDSNKARYRIPIPAMRYQGESGVECAIVAGPVIADLMFPRGSWPWTWTRELAFLAADNWREGPFTGNDTDGGYVREYNRALRDPGTSLWGRWMMIEFPPRALRPETIQALSRLSLQIETLGFEHEIRRLLHGEQGLARVAQAVVYSCDEMDDAARQLLLKNVDKLSRSMLRRLFEQRAARPEESPEDAIEAVLIDHWKNGGSSAIEERLKDLAGTAAPSAQSATKPVAETIK